MFKTGLFFLAAAIVLSLTIPAVPLSAQGKPPAGPSPIVAGRIVSVRRAAIETFVGTLQAKRKSIVGSAVDGRVISIEVERGDPVGADPESARNEFVGQPLIQLRTGTLDIEIATAETQLELVQQAADELCVSLPREIELAKANASEADARLEYSKANYERAQRLGGKSGAISQGELDQARSQFHADQHAANGEDIAYRKLVATQELRLQQVRKRSIRREHSRSEFGIYCYAKYGTASTAGCVGTVVNNAILIVNQSLVFMKKDGLDPRKAIAQSIRTRIRPIFMTTATTVFGLSPLVFFPGAGSELYRGLGSVVLGGLLISTFFTLFLVPTLFSLMLDLKTVVRRAG